MSRFRITNAKATAIGIALVCAALSARAHAGVNYYGQGYKVGVIRPGGDRECTLFQLQGVTEADPALIPGTAWFSIPHIAPGYKEMIATLLLAKATDRVIYLETSGQSPSGCGHVGVSVLFLP